MWMEKHSPVFNDRELEQMGLPRAVYQEFLSESSRLLRSVRGGSIHVTLSRFGIDHLDFSDNPFWSTSASPDVRAAKTQTLAIARSYLLAFFDGCLRGQWRQLRDLVDGKAYPEVSARVFGRIPGF